MGLQRLDAEDSGLAFVLSLIGAVGEPGHGEEFLLGGLRVLMNLLAQLSGLGGQRRSGHSLHARHRQIVGEVGHLVVDVAEVVSLRMTGGRDIAHVTSRQLDDHVEDPFHLEMRVGLEPSRHPLRVSLGPIHPLRKGKPHFGAACREVF